MATVNGGAKDTPPNSGADRKWNDWITGERLLRWGGFQACERGGAQPLPSIIHSDVPPELTTERIYLLLHIVNFG